MTKMLEHEQQEQEGVDLLTGMMGGELAVEEARRLLRKHKGDVQKAADAMLGGDRGEEEDALPALLAPDSQATVQAAPSPSVRQDGTQKTVIDLTEEDDHMRPNRWDNTRGRQQEPNSGPSQREPHPDWQLVPASSHGKIEPVETQDDRSLKDAIQASLADFQKDEVEIFPPEKSIREGGRPVALRAGVPGVAYAALALQALFMVPHVRESVAGLRLPDVDPAVESSAQHATWKLVELFTNLDLVQLSAIVDEHVIPAFNAEPWDGTRGRLGELTATFINQLAHVVESHLSAQRMDEDEDEVSVRLFNFTHTSVQFRGGIQTPDKLTHGSIVTIDVDLNSPPDLISKLSACLTRIDGDAIIHDVIVEPSDLVLFQLTHGPEQPPQSVSTVGGKSSPELFTFPKSFHLDRFTIKNLSLAHEKRSLEKELREKIIELRKQKEFLTHHNGQDTIQNLRSSLHYFEHVAESKGDPEREQALMRTRKKLQNILMSLTQTVDSIEQQVEKLQSELVVVFDCPELQQERYDLRAVLMHTGLPGRKQIYSYVKDNQGVWWKILDHDVSEVPEDTVLTDPTGLHLGAGPYLLIYSRHLPAECLRGSLTWPPIFEQIVQESNQHYLSMLPAELAAKANVALNHHEEMSQPMHVDPSEVLREPSLMDVDDQGEDS